jgi:hypothetical protein
MTENEQKDNERKKKKIDNDLPRDFVSYSQASEEDNSTFKESIYCPVCKTYFSSMASFNAHQSIHR